MINHRITEDGLCLQSVRAKFEVEEEKLLTQKRRHAAGLLASMVAEVVLEKGRARGPSVVQLQVLQAKGKGKGWSSNRIEVSISEAVRMAKEKLWPSQAPTPAPAQNPLFPYQYKAPPPTPAFYVADDLRTFCMIVADYDEEHFKECLTDWAKSIRYSATFSNDNDNGLAPLRSYGVVLDPFDSSRTVPGAQS